MFGIGIDVSKATLDVAVHGEQFRQFSNDKRGFVRLIRWLKTWPIRSFLRQGVTSVLLWMHCTPPACRWCESIRRVHGDLPKARAVPQRPIGSMRRYWRRWPICYR